MNVSLKNNNALSGIVKLEIVKADYADQVNKSLRSLRQKANMPGFRRGMVPMNLVKKMYGKHVLVEEINKLVSENLAKYIAENDLHVLGEPIPNETEQRPQDFDKDEDFEFYFDVAFAPEIHIELSKNDKIPYYNVVISDEMVNEQIDEYRSRFGSYEEVNEVCEEDLMKGRIAELENGVPKEGGLVGEDVALMVMHFNNEEEKAKFIGAKRNSVIVFNPSKAFKGMEDEIAHLLGIDTKKAADITGDFSYEIQKISRNKKAELNQELYDQVLGKDVVTSEEMFRDKLRESFANQFKPQSDFKFLLDIREILEEKAGELKFDDNLLKRWLLMINENSSIEKVEESYPTTMKELTYQLIKEHLVKKNNLQVMKEDIERYAKRMALAQYAQYGILSVPDSVLDNYVTDIMKNEKNRQTVISRTLEEKLADWMKEQIEVENKDVTPDEFNRLFE